MSEALSFTKIKLGALQGFLCVFPVSDVLNRTKYFVRSSRRVSFHSPNGLDSTHFAGGANDAMFWSQRAPPLRMTASAAAKTYSLVLRVHHFANHCHVKGASLWRQAVDAIKFGRPIHAVHHEVPFEVADVGNTLCFFKTGLTFLQVAKINPRSSSARFRSVTSWTVPNI